MKRTVGYHDQMGSEPPECASESLPVLKTSSFKGAELFACFGPLPALRAPGRRRGGRPGGYRAVGKNRAVGEKSGLPAPGPDFRLTRSRHRSASPGGSEAHWIVARCDGSGCHSGWPAVGRPARPQRQSIAACSSFIGRARAHWQAVLVLVVDSTSTRCAHRPLARARARGDLRGVQP